MYKKFLVITFSLLGLAACGQPDMETKGQLPLVSAQMFETTAESKKKLTRCAEKYAETDARVCGKILSAFESR